MWEEVNILAGAYIHPKANRMIFYSIYKIL